MKIPNGPKNKFVAPIGMGVVGAGGGAFAGDYISKELGKRHFDNKLKKVLNSSESKQREFLRKYDSGEMQNSYRKKRELGRGIGTALGTGAGIGLGLGVNKMTKTASAMETIDYHYYKSLEE